MRAVGVPERLITGDASDWEKFAAWAATVPQTLRNPLYHWTHLELRFPFGLRGKLLNADSAREIFEHCNARLREDGFTTQGLLRQFQVRVVCSTDDPIDDLEPHRRHAADPGRATQLLPTWRPDKALALNDLPAWNGWVDALGAAAQTSVGTLDDLGEALRRRHDAFHAAGCRASDHGLERVYATDYTEREVTAAFERARGGAALSPDEIEKLRSALLVDLARLDHRRGWVQQLHLGALRDTSTRATRALGPNTGYDAIGDFPQAVALAQFLDRLDATNQLAKAIVYNLNPAHEGRPNTVPLAPDEELRGAEPLRPKGRRCWGSRR